MTWTCGADFDDTTEPSAVSPELLALCETEGERVCQTTPRSRPPIILISSVPPPAIEVDVTRSRILVPRWGASEPPVAPLTARVARLLWRLLTAPLRYVGAITRSGTTCPPSRDRP